MTRVVALWRVVSARRVLQLGATFVLMLVAGLAEMLTIGAVLPFLALLVLPGAALPPYAQDGLRLIAPDPLLAGAILLVSAAVLAALARLLLAWAIQRTVAGVGHDLASDIFHRMLRQPYQAYARRHSSEILSGIEKVQNVIFGFLQPLMLAVAAAFIACFVVGVLFWIDVVAATAAALGLGGFYLLVSVATRRRLARNSRMLADAGRQRLQIVQEALGSIRDILIDRSQPVFEDRFARSKADYLRAHATTQLLATAPRFLIEAFGIVAIVVIALAMGERPGGIAAAIPVLGAFALAAQRLLPLLQQVYFGWSVASGNFATLVDVLRLIDAPVAPQPDPDRKPLSFERRMALQGVSFGYDDERATLDHIDLTIAKGERIGIVGTTGSGKSTLLDLMMGLIEPRSGLIRIDGAILDADTAPAWHDLIAHVPQSIYLADATIAENIAFGLARGAIDRERVRAAAETAQLGRFIDALPAGFDSIVGERGARLSGGQRQRLGIARALYKNPSILFLDEATSALDDATERKVMQSIFAIDPGITIVIASHRLSALAYCDAIVALDDGQVRR